MPDRSERHPDVPARGSEERTVAPAPGLVVVEVDDEDPDDDDD